MASVPPAPSSSVESGMSPVAASPNPVASGSIPSMKRTGSVTGLPSPFPLCILGGGTTCACRRERSATTAAPSGISLRGMASAAVSSRPSMRLPWRTGSKPVSPSAPGSRAESSGSRREAGSSHPECGPPGRMSLPSFPELPGGCVRRSGSSRFLSSHVKSAPRPSFSPSAAFRAPCPGVRGTTSGAERAGIAFIVRFPPAAFSHRRPWHGP